METSKVEKESRQRLKNQNRIFKNYGTTTKGVMYIVMRIPGEWRERGVEEIFAAIMTEKFPKLDTKIYIQEAYRISSRINA